MVVVVLQTILRPGKVKFLAKPNRLDGIVFTTWCKCWGLYSYGMLMDRPYLS
jgi:hypothetical protein